SEKDKLSLKAQFEEDETLWLITDKRPSKMLTSLVSRDRILQIDVIDRWGSKGIKTEKPLARWQL
ncbi:ABC transporter substrate-binding protein, partial [Vibrio parahaemolyticus]